MLWTVRQLQSGTVLDSLCRTYKLSARHHALHPIVQLSYSQRESDLGNAVVQECRGLILETGSWGVVCWPFAKFFNADEPNAAATAHGFDWSSADVFEKCDGSLLTLYWYGDRWNVSSSSLPAADGQLPSGGPTFAETFWRTWEAAGYRLPENKRMCYMFELTLPQHTIVVRHAVAAITFLGARDLDSLAEVGCGAIAEAQGWATPRRYPKLTSLAAVQAAARGLNPVAQEGFVAVDPAFRRLKIKSPAYVALHHMGAMVGEQVKRDYRLLSDEDQRMRDRRLIEIARTREGDEFLAYFPDLRTSFRSALVRLQQLRVELRVRAATRRQYRGVAIEALAEAVRGGATVDQALQAAEMRRVETALAEMGQPGVRVTDAAVSDVATEGQPPNDIQVTQAADASTQSPAPAGAPSATTGRPWSPLPRLLVLVGLPGSGKSTFADALVASGNGWRRVCQDELGSRRAVEAEVECLAAKDTTRLVIDRCNVTLEERMHWLQLAALPVISSTACVFFDTRPSECERRVRSRAYHPTLSRGSNKIGVAVHSKAKALVAPRADEGFSTLLTVRGFGEANALLNTWGARPPSEVRGAAVAAGERLIRLMLIDCCGSTKRGEKKGPGAVVGVMLVRPTYPTIVAAASNKLMLRPKDAARLCLTLRGKETPLTPSDCEGLWNGAMLCASLKERGPATSQRAQGQSVEGALAESHAAQGVGEKASAMRTARDVIDRCFWDERFDAERVAVGYVDRLAGGVVERPLCSFTWDDLAAVGPEALAVPQHRIEYVKYDGVRVWDKATRLDMVFGSSVESRSRPSPSGVCVRTAACIAA